MNAHTHPQLAADYSNAFRLPSQASAAQDAIAAHMRAAAWSEGHRQAVPKTAQDNTPSPSQADILDAIRAAGAMTSLQLGEQLPHLPQATIVDGLCRLSALKLIKSVGRSAGRGRNIIWAVDGYVPPPPELPKDARAAIMAVLRCAPMEGRMIAHKAELSAVQFRDALGQLRKDGRVRDSGKRAGNWIVWEACQ